MYNWVRDRQREGKDERGRDSGSKWVFIVLCVSVYSAVVV